MPKYTHKPFEVDAVQFRVDQSINLWPGSVEADPTTGAPFIPQAGGRTIPVQDGDWIISQPGQPIRVCDDQSFNYFYEKVKE